MYKIDFHNHTDFSADCNENINEVVEKAIEKNIKEIALTEHLEIETGLSNIYTLDFEKYLKVGREIKEEYRGAIRVRLGLEVGYSDIKHKEVDYIIEKSNLDFVILSIHSIGNIGFLDNTFFKDKNKEEAYTKYFEKVYEGICRFKNYDVLGHIDFISRYGEYSDKSLKYGHYKEVIDKILKKLIEDGKGLEVNTSGKRYGESFYPSIEILKRYRELGGTRITVGSDSHKKEDIGYGIEEAIDCLKEIGFIGYSVFEKRREKIIKF